MANLKSTDVYPNGNPLRMKSAEKKKEHGAAKRLREALGLPEFNWKRGGHYTHQELMEMAAERLVSGT